MEKLNSKAFQRYANPFATHLEATYVYIHIYIHVAIVNRTFAEFRDFCLCTVCSCRQPVDWLLSTCNTAVFGPKVVGSHDKELLSLASGTI